LPSHVPSALFIPESNHERRDTVATRHQQSRPVSQDTEIEEDDNDDDPQFATPRAPTYRPSVNEARNDPNFETMLQQAINGNVDTFGVPKTDLGFKKNGEPRKRRAKNAREVFLQKNEKQKQKEREKARKKAEKEKAAAAKAKARTKGKGKQAPKKGKSKVIKNGESLLKGSGSSWGRSGEDEVGRRILADLMVTDDINARLTNPMYTLEPGQEIIGKQKKTTQFETLFSNVPEGSNKAVIRDDKRQLRQAAQAFGYAKVRAQNGEWKVKGLRSTIFHHQLLGARWMVERELSAQAPFGGILADSMGECRRQDAMGDCLHTRSWENNSDSGSYDCESSARSRHQTQSQSNFDCLSGNTCPTVDRRDREAC